MTSNEIIEEYQIDHNGEIAVLKLELNATFCTNDTDENNYEVYDVLINNVTNVEAYDKSGGEVHMHKKYDICRRLLNEIDYEDLINVVQTQMNENDNKGHLDLR